MDSKAVISTKKARISLGDRESFSTVYIIWITTRQGTRSWSRDIALGQGHGQDFDPREEWGLYHGEAVPGFPRILTADSRRSPRFLKGLIVIGFARVRGDVRKR